MDDEHIAIRNAGVTTANVGVNRYWQAHLCLHFDHDFQNGQMRSFLAKKLHSGPLVVQKTLHPEGSKVCHAIVVHPPGGVAGGDQLTLKVDLGTQAQALLTTPGAGKWYKANGHDASQILTFKLADQACLEWLPQENILFDGAQVRFSAEIELANQAVYAGWDIICLGRQAQKERWQTGKLQQQLTIKRNQKLIWQECANLDPAMPVIKSLAGLGGNAVFGSLVIAAGVVPPEVLAACREVKPVAEAQGHYYGVTALPEIFSARYVGQSSQAARRYFEQLWGILRPWYAGREAIRPRIWNT